MTSDEFLSLPGAAQRLIVTAADIIGDREYCDIPNDEFAELLLVFNSLLFLGLMPNKEIQQEVARRAEMIRARDAHPDRTIN